MLTIRIVDGWSVERRIASTFDDRGSFSGMTKWPVITVGWSRQLVSIERTLRGRIRRDVFLAIIGPTDGGHGCSGSVIMLPGPVDRTKAWETLVSIREEVGWPLYRTTNSTCDRSEID